MRQEEIWDDEAARTYDTPGSGMFAPSVLDPTVSRLAALAGEGRALEFAIGTGRVGIPLSERGVPVTGIELSQPMIDRLLSKADLPVLRGDMTTTRAPGTYALVYLVFNTIGNLQTQDEQVECFRNAARHLDPGGRFVIELGVPALRLLPPGQDTHVFAMEPGYVGIDEYDVVSQRLVSHHVRYGTDAPSSGRGEFRYAWPAELDLMARIAGLTLESRSADWSGTPFTADSTSHVSVYRLPT